MAPVKFLHCDLIAHELMEPGNASYKALIQEFGEEILEDRTDSNTEGMRCISRPRLSAVAMATADTRKRLNEITHPLVRKAVEEKLEYLRKERFSGIVVIEAALLLEAGYKELCDSVWYVHAPVEDRKRRMRQNRGYSEEKIAEILLERTGLTGNDGFHTIHNYIDTEEMILRKGAIAAHEGEKVLIPINMKDGSVLAIGRGNEEWNYSAPHGAGRLMSRRSAKEYLNMDEYREVMKGIYTTSVNEATLDEAPMAYKALEDIIDVIKESVDVIEVMKPIYNYKAN